MPAYLIVLRESPTRDADAYAEYLRANHAATPPVRPTPLAAYGTIEGLEGVAPDGAVVLKFDSVEDAHKWYDSPDYQAALPHRLRSADWRAFIIQGL